MRMIFSNCADGFAGSGAARNIATTFRPTCTGVSTSPQGKPHHPSTRERAASPSWLLTPHPRQEICGVLFHDVRKMADQTSPETCWLLALRIGGVDREAELGCLLSED